MKKRFDVLHFSSAFLRFFNVQAFKCLFQFVKFINVLILPHAHFVSSIAYILKCKSIIWVTWVKGWTSKIKNLKTSTVLRNMIHKSRCLAYRLPDAGRHRTNNNPTHSLVFSDPPMNTKWTIKMPSRYRKIIKIFRLFINPYVPQYPYDI